MIITFHRTVEIQVATEQAEFVHAGRIESGRFFWMMQNYPDLIGPGLILTTHDVTPLAVQKLDKNKSLKESLENPGNHSDSKGFEIVDVWFSETKQNHEYLFKLLDQEINESDN